jgi:FtsP/CotA-like multicopper oxidase with cupredoxin domain
MNRFTPALVALALCTPFAAKAADIPPPADECDRLETLYPEPGRQGLPGDNAFRPLPVEAPIRSFVGAPGTLSLSISVDHVSTAPAGKPGYVYVGNYAVTDIPVYRITHGAGTSSEVINPDTGHEHPMPDRCLDSPSWGFGGTQWALVQGDTLDVMLSSKLDYTGNTAIQMPTNGAVPCRASNLHTHGLLVSPYHPQRAGLGPYGDYIYDVTQPHGSDDNGSSRDTCGTNLGQIEHLGHGLTNLPLHYSTYIPGQPGVNSMVTGEHPSGLFWYHPHPHGFAQPQVAGGTTGAITVGALTDYACPNGDGVPGSCTITNTNVRVLVLKDTEIQQSKAGNWETRHSSESGYCPTTGGVRHGECDSDGTKLPGKWIFTINGVQYPTMKAKAGQMEIWRIVNASSNVSYGLTIAPAAKGGPNLPFQVLATDGVSVRPKYGKDMRQALMIMPATRVEIAIPAPADGGTYILQNISMQTGQSGSGDIWPNVELGRIDWVNPEPGAAQIPNPPTEVAVAGPTTPIPSLQNTQSGLPGRCIMQPGDTRVIYFTHRFLKVYNGALPDGAKIHQVVDADDDTPNTPPPPSGLAPSVHEIFGLIAGVRHADGHMDFWGEKGKVLHSVEAVWNEGVEYGDNDFPGFGHNNFSSICTVKGNIEPWELQNWTGEDHNFHIHQSRFSLNPSGTFQFPDPKLEPTEDAGLRSTDTFVRDFVDPQYADTYHDTVPVPRGQSLCRANPTGPGCHGDPTLECSGKPGAPRCARPGILSVLMDFSRAEQVGKFVYHCHILEHEDGGMMAQITVMCPVGDASCASQQARENICRTPQTN